MSPRTSSTAMALQLLAMTNSLPIHQALYSAAKLGVADLLKDGAQTSSDLARNLNVNESALYRVLRLLASQSVFEEQSPRTFANTELSYFLRTRVPGSVRSILIFRGSEFIFGPFGEILYSIETGRAARAKMYGMEVLRLFEDASRNRSNLRRCDDGHVCDVGPVVAEHTSREWGSLMDVGAETELCGRNRRRIEDCAACSPTCPTRWSERHIVAFSAANSQHAARRSLVHPSRSASRLPRLPDGRHDPRLGP